MLREIAWFETDILDYCLDRCKTEYELMHHLERFPGIKLPKGCRTNEICPICYDTYGEHGKTLMIRTKCQHHFCWSCMKNYISKCNKSLCPCCKQDMFVHMSLNDLVVYEDNLFKRMHGGIRGNYFTQTPSRNKYDNYFTRTSKQQAKIK